MSDLSRLYWIARCDGCGKPITAHAMSVLREAMLCLECLNAESQAIEAERVAGHAIVLASDTALEPVLPQMAAPLKRVAGGLGK